jgi:hypothetical protein
MNEVHRHSGLALPHNKPSSPGLTGRSSIPERRNKLQRSAILGRPLSRAVTAVCGMSDLAHIRCRGFVTKVIREPLPGTKTGTGEAQATILIR